MMSMTALMSGLLPVLSAFALGVWLRRGRGVGPGHADRLLRVVADLALPALIFAAVSDLPLDAELAFLPLAGALMVLSMWPVSWLVARALRLPRSARGVLVTGPMIMNLALVYALVAAWGDRPAIARLALIDFGNVLLTFTLVYALAAWYGRRDARLGAAVTGVVSFPPFWALCLAVAVNLSGWQPPAQLNSALAGFGRIMVLLVPLALGIYFRPPRARGAALAWGVGLRLGVGALLGLACIRWLPLEPLSATVVMVAAMAPVGFNTLVFAAREGLDRELAASLASISVLVAFVLLPAWLWWRPPVGV